MRRPRSLKLTNGINGSLNNRKGNIATQRRTLLGVIHKPDSFATMIKIANAFVPNRALIVKMLSELNKEVGREQLAALLHVSVFTLDKWRTCRSFPSGMSLKLLWLLWSIKFNGDNLSSWISILNWGRLKGDIDQVKSLPGSDRVKELQRLAASTNEGSYQPCSRIETLAGETGTLPDSVPKKDPSTQTSPSTTVCG